MAIKTVFGQSLAHRMEQRSSVAYSPDGKWVIPGSPDKSICVWNVETRDDPIWTPDVFCSCRYRNANGWTTQRPGISPLFTNSVRPLLFWVPPHSREGLCDSKHLTVLGRHRTQLDLGQFVHGTSWIDCKDSSATPYGLGVWDV